MDSPCPFPAYKTEFFALTLSVELLSWAKFRNSPTNFLKSSFLLGKMEWKKWRGNPDETSKEWEIPAEVFLFSPSIKLEISNR
jgi:hypothetical protein